MKYRVRLKTGRMIGPFDEQEILQLFEKGHLEGKEQCQIFPTGKWRPLGDFKEFSAITQGANESTMLNYSLPSDIDKKTESGRNIEAPIEYEYKKDGSLDLDYDEIRTNVEKKEKEENEHVNEIERELEKREALVDKTVLHKKEKALYDKTTLVNKDVIEFQKIKEEGEVATELDEEKEMITEEKVSLEEPTVVGDFSKELNQIKQEADESERGLEAKIKEEIEKKGDTSLPQDSLTPDDNKPESKKD